MVYSIWGYILTTAQRPYSETQFEAVKSKYRKRKHCSLIGKIIETSEECRYFFLQKTFLITASILYDGCIEVKAILAREFGFETCIFCTDVMLHLACYKKTRH